MKEGGAYLNNERVTDAEAVPGEDAWLPGGWLVCGAASASVAPGVRRSALSRCRRVSGVTQQPV